MWGWDIFNRRKSESECINGRRQKMRAILGRANKSSSSHLQNILRESPKRLLTHFLMLYRVKVVARWGHWLIFLRNWSPCTFIRLPKNFQSICYIVQSYLLPRNSELSPSSILIPKTKKFWKSCVVAGFVWLVRGENFKSAMHKEGKTCMVRSPLTPFITELCRL